MDSKKILETHEHELNMASLILVFMFCASLLTNFMVLRVFVRNHKLRKPINFYTIALTVLNFIGTLIHMPLIIVAITIKRIPFGHKGCQIQAYIYVVSANLTLFFLMILSIKRYWIVVRPYEFHKITFKLCFKILISCVSFSCIFSSLPFWGWSHYNVEINGLFCSLEFNERSAAVVSYGILCILIFWTIPFCAILYTNIKLFLILRSKTNRLVYLNGKITFENKKLLKRKRHQLIIVVLLTTGYLTSWTPYVLIMLYGAFKDVSSLSYGLTLVPMIACKSTAIWCPIMEILFNSNVRKNILFIREYKREKVIMANEEILILDNSQKRQSSDSSNYKWNTYESNRLNTIIPGRMQDVDFSRLRELEIFELSRMN